MKLALIAIALLALGFAGIAIKIWAKKGGEFEGTCASNNPMINGDGENCSFCGARPDEQCMSDTVAQ
ncbi:MAG: membrane or secreted protein [Crocinitomicaceae bacterium]